MNFGVAALRRINPGHAVPLLAACLEVLWVYPWLVWVSKWQGLGWDKPPISLTGALIVCVWAQMWSRFALSSKWSLNIVRPAVLVLSLALVALVLRLEHGAGYGLLNPGWWTYVSSHRSIYSTGLVFSFYLVWRGFSVGRGRLHFDDLYQKFFLGLLGLVVLLILMGLTARGGTVQREVASAGLYVTAYFAVGLLAMALANLRAVREEMLRKEGESGLFGCRWLLLLVGVVVTILAVAMVAASLFSFDLARLVFRPLDALANWVFVAIMYGIGIPISFFVAGLLYVLRWLLHLFKHGPRPEQFDSSIPNATSDLIKGTESALPAGFLLALKWGIVGMVLAVVVLILSRALFRYMRARKEDEVEEVQESLWSWGAFKADVRSFFAGLLRYFRRKKVIEQRDAGPPLAVEAGQGPFRLYSVREIYQGLLWEGRRVGYPRHKSETPYEYQLKMKNKVGAYAQELADITRAYVEEHYGGVQVSEEKLQLLNQVWLRLRSSLEGQTQ